ncbi:MAG: hypothetical protein FJZ57_05840, partial [Chlamydiae bacterium]|nr:hypothetical protein [Chlamydiota bacterium]
MKKIGLFFGFFLTIISIVQAHDQSSFSVYSYLKNGTNRDSFDFLKDTDTYEIIREKTEQNVKNSSKVKTLKIRLKNGLEVLLLSDPDVTQSSAAIS